MTLLTEDVEVVEVEVLDPYSSQVMLEQGLLR
jgi:hypothetical protein